MNAGGGKSQEKYQSKKNPETYNISGQNSLVRISSVVVLLRELRYDAFTCFMPTLDQTVWSPPGIAVSPRIITIPWVNHPPYWPETNTPKRNQWNLNLWKLKDRKKGLFLVISKHSSWTQSNEICSLSVAISQHPDQPATLTLACFPEWLPSKWRDVLVFLRNRNPSTVKQAGEYGKTHDEPQWHHDPCQMTHRSMNGIKHITKIIQKTPTTKTPTAMLSLTGHVSGEI